MANSNSQFPLTGFRCILVFRLSFSCLKQEQRASLGSRVSARALEMQFGVCCLITAQKAHAQRSTCLEHSADLRGHCWHSQPCCSWSQHGQKQEPCGTGYKLGGLGKSPSLAPVAKVLHFGPFPSLEIPCSTGVLPLDLLFQHFSALSAY